MMPPSARFRRADRVVSARDYARVSRRGKRLASRNFAVSIAERATSRDASSTSGPRKSSRSSTTSRPGEAGDQAHTRLGLSVSRRIGNAVERNRVKRAIREWFRGSRDRVPKGVDIVVIARRGAAVRRTEEIARELDTLFAERRAQVKPGVGE